MQEKNLRFVVVVAAALVVGHVGAQEPHDRHSHQFAKDIDAFHAVLAPLWHSRPGAERSRNVCAKAGQMETLSKEIRSADAGKLSASSVALKKRCQASPNDIDGALFDVHEAFHHLAEPGGH